MPKDQGGAKHRGVLAPPLKPPLVVALKGSNHKNHTKKIKKSSHYTLDVLNGWLIFLRSIWTMDVNLKVLKGGGVNGKG